MILNESKPNAVNCLFFFLTSVQARNFSSSAKLYITASKPVSEIPLPAFEEAHELFLQCFLPYVSLPQTPFSHLLCPSASWFTGNLQC